MTCGRCGTETVVQALASERRLVVGCLGCGRIVSKGIEIGVPRVRQLLTGSGERVGFPPFDHRRVESTQGGDDRRK